MAVFWVVAPLYSGKEFTDVSEVLSAFIIALIIVQTTRLNNPEDSRLHTRRRKHLKSHHG
jgi:hypothetical protein